MDVGWSRVASLVACGLLVFLPSVTSLSTERAAVKRDQRDAWLDPLAFKSLIIGS